VVSRLLPQAAALSFMQCADAEFRGSPVILTRSGYTGERGFELFPRGEVIHELWADLLEAGRGHGMAPIGLGARDTLRLEMGYPLHGQDISPERTPLEAALSWAVALEKGDFRGRDALVRQQQEGIPARLWGLRMEGRLIPRAHQQVLADGEPAGEVTSGTFSPTLRMGVGLAYLAPRERFSAGDVVQVDVRGRLGDAVVTRPPFVGSSPK
jgi:aminomethyltransferase